MLARKNDGLFVATHHCLNNRTNGFVSDWKQLFVVKIFSSDKLTEDTPR
jgi:hypothetical protein